jgi:hypothetical protein
MILSILFILRELWGWLGVNSCFQAGYSQIGGHAVTAEDALGAAIGETAGPDNVAGRLFSGNAIR